MESELTMEGKIGNGRFNVRERIDLPKTKAALEPLHIVGVGVNRIGTEERTKEYEKPRS